MTAMTESRRPRVVIVEDFLLIQEDIRRSVAGVCDVVAAVAHGEAALAVAAEHSPDILLLDISLPDISGFRVAERLFARHRSIHVIFVTSHGDRMFVERAFELGARGYVLKGAMSKELPEAIEAVRAGGRYQSSLIRAKCA